MQVRKVKVEKSGGWDKTKRRSLENGIRKEEEVWNKKKEGV